MNTTKREGENAESRPLNLRLPHALHARLDAVASKLPIVSRHRLAVAALDLGLAALDADPSVILRVGLPSPAPPAKARARTVARAIPAPAVLSAPVVATVPDPRQLPLPPSPAVLSVPVLAPPVETNFSCRATPEAVRAELAKLRATDGAGTPLDANSARARARPVAPEGPCATCGAGVWHDCPRCAARTRECSCTAAGDGLCVTCAALPVEAPPVAVDAIVTARRPTLDAVRAQLVALHAADPTAWSNRATAERAGCSKNVINAIMRGASVRPEGLAKVAAVLPKG